MESKYNIVEVEWEDITFYSGNYYINDVENYGLKRIKTIGYLIEDNKKYATLCMGLETTEENKCVDFIKIPKKNIIKIKIIYKGVKVK